jgi:hypothetical protein
MYIFIYIYVDTITVTYYNGTIVYYIPYHDNSCRCITWVNAIMVYSFYHDHGSTLLASVTIW